MTCSISRKQLLAPHCSPTCCQDSSWWGDDGALNKALQATAAQQCDTHLHARNVGSAALKGVGVALPLLYVAPSQPAVQVCSC